MHFHRSLWNILKHLVNVKSFNYVKTAVSSFPFQVTSTLCMSCFPFVFFETDCDFYEN